MHIMIFAEQIWRLDNQHRARAKENEIEKCCFRFVYLRFCFFFVVARAIASGRKLPNFSSCLLINMRCAYFVWRCCASDIWSDWWTRSYYIFVCLFVLFYVSGGRSICMPRNQRCNLFQTHHKLRNNFATLIAVGDIHIYIVVSLVVFSATIELEWKEIRKRRSKYLHCLSDKEHSCRAKTVNYSNVWLSNWQMEFLIQYAL